MTTKLLWPVREISGSGLPPGTLRLADIDQSPGQNEAGTFRISGPGLNDTIPVQTDDSVASKIRWFSGSSVTNDSSGNTAIVPANANGQPDGAVATVKTNNSTGNLLATVILTSTMNDLPAGLTFSAARVRVWFEVPARTAQLDTITLRYNIGAGDVIFYTHAGNAVVNHLTAGLAFNLPAGITLAQLNAMTLVAQYTASVATAPETRIRLDAWAIEVDRIL